MVIESGNTIKKSKFDPSHSLLLADCLKPEMWKTKGFVMDKNMTNLSQMLSSRGIDCVQTDHKMSKENCKKALALDKIFITQDIKLFNEKTIMQICCVNKKESSNQ